MFSSLLNNPGETTQIKMQITVQSNWWNRLEKALPEKYIANFLSYLILVTHNRCKETKTQKLQNPPSVPWVQWNPRPNWRRTWESRSLRSGFAGHRPSSAAISFDRDWYTYIRKDQSAASGTKTTYQESTNYTINNANAKHQKHSWRHHGKFNEEPSR